MYQLDADEDFDRAMLRVSPGVSSIHRLSPPPIGVGAIGDRNVPAIATTSLSVDNRGDGRNLLCTASIISYVFVRFFT